MAVSAPPAGDGLAKAFEAALDARQEGVGDA
jgi:hypothetical protein